MKIKIFLKTIVSIPGAKPKNDVEELKKKIQDFVINKKLYSDTAKYMPDNITEKIVKVKVEERFEKSERDENDWYLWNISLELSREFSGDESVEYVVYRFNPTFQDRREDNKLYAKGNESNFSINVIGWEDTKFEIEMKHKNGSISKMVSKLEKGGKQDKATAA